MANLDEIQIKITQDSSKASSAIDSLINSLGKLEEASDLQKVSTNIDVLSNSLQNLSDISKNFKMGDIASQLENIPNAIKSFGELPVQDLQQFTNTMQVLTDTLTPLANSANSIAPLISALNNLSPTALKVIQKNQQLQESNKKVAPSFSQVASSIWSNIKGIASWGIGLGAITKYVADSTRLASKYTQTVNMLNTVMGDGAEEAKEFAQELGDVLGLNPADVMNFQATFQNLFVGFGNNAKQAQIMSKNLTQLSYDMAAFYEQLGGDPQAAAEKLRLAMAGTIEPIQRLGYAIKEADLQAVAARQGLNVNIRNLNTASKSMLRYIAVMEQSNHVQGYMAKSFSSPTTAMMVFQSAVKQLSTEIGKTFLPMLMAAIPYIQAFITGVLNMVKTINSILGIELPTIEGWEKTKEGISGIGDEATQTGKKIQKAFTLGIDELNVLDSSAADAGAGMQDITGQLKLPEYNMLEGFDSDTIKKIEETLKPLEPLFKGMAEAFAGFYNAVSWLGGDVFYPWLVDIGEWMEENPDTMWLIGQGLAYIGAGLLILKVLGKAGAILGLPNLFTSMKNGIVDIYKSSDKKLIPTLKTLGLRLAGVAALALAVYSALQIAKTVIDIKKGEIQGWEAFRELVGWTAATIGFAGLALAAFGVGVSAVASAAIAIFGLVLANWEDFAFSAQWLFANLGKILNVIFKGIAATIVTVFQAVVLVIAEVVEAIVWAVVKGVEVLAELAMNAIKGIASGIDKIFNTNLAAKVSTEFDFTSGIEESMSGMLDRFSHTMKTVWGDVADTAMSDIWETDYMKRAEEMYWEATKDKYTGNEEGAVETIAGELRTWFSDYQSGNEEIEKELADLNSKQAQFTDQTSEQIETQKITNEEIANLKNEINSLKTEQQNIEMPDVTEALGESTELQTTANELASAANTLQTDFNSSALAYDDTTVKTLSAANTLQKATTNDILSAIKSVGSAITSALREVEDACRNIKIEVHKHYGGGDGYASGGFPTSGEMFFAREDGLPEMVGRVGRQTAVMNNGQIADTMAQSLIRAMNQGRASQQPTVIENKLYLDGEVVYNNQQKIQRSKGYNLGMGVFANV